jgi:hypothetical protein
VAMDQKTLETLAVFASGYGKRFMEGGYDRIMETRLGRKAQAIPKSGRYGIEAGLYALMAYADGHVKTNSALGQMFKDIALDVPTEIAWRLVKGAREQCGSTASPDQDPEGQAVAETLRSLDDESFVKIAQWARDTAATKNRDNAIEVIARRVDPNSARQAGSALVSPSDDPILDAAIGVNNWLERARTKLRKRRGESS